MGNLNRLVHGNRSKQIQPTIEKLASDPTLKPLLKFLAVLSARYNSIKIRIKGR